MTSTVEICNFALDFLGQTTTIPSLTDQSKAARVCARHYQQAVDELIAAHPWPFARKSIILAETVDTPLPGWEYQYAYPADCARAWRVCGEDGIRSHWREYWASCYGQNGHLQVPIVPFEVVSGGSQTCLVTDLEDAYLLYTVKQANPSRFPPLFVNALAWHLAAKIAMPLTVEPRIMESAENKAAIAAAIAQAEGFNESVPDPDPVPPSIAARG